MDKKYRKRVSKYIGTNYRYSRCKHAHRTDKLKNVNKVSKEQWYNKLKIVDPNCFLTLKSPLKDHLRSQTMVPRVTVTIPYNFDLEQFFRPTLRFFTIPRFVRTDRQTDGQTDRVIAIAHPLHCKQAKGGQKRNIQKTTRIKRN
jgi:hypothetical protein